MKEGTNSSSPGIKKSDESLAESTDSKLGEMVELLKKIDGKLEFALRAIREINARG